MSALVYYFPSTGRAEVIKLALDLAGIPYTFKGVQNWPEEKVEGLKSGYLPFGQVPMVEMDGLHMVESLAILGHISRVYLSKNADEKTLVQIDVMVNAWNDILNKYFGAVFGTPEKLEQFMKEEAPKQLAMVENLHKTYGTKFMASNEPSIADAHAYATMKMIKGQNASILDQFPELKAWEAAMNELEGVKKYNA